MRLLIIGNLGGQIGAASKIAIARGAKVEVSDDVASGLETLRSGKGADLVLIDVMQDVSGLVGALASERIVVPVVACGTGNDTSAAVSAIKAGAQEYLPLPPDAELIGAVLTAVAEEANTIIHGDPRMSEVLNMASRIAPSEASILITGASGTGKEMMACFIHQKSKRKDKPFVAVNCAAIPENLLESELFGYEKGAFTGAVSRRIGKFEEANGGTLLLDEISEMDPRLQAKLLRAIQEREIDRLGSNKPIKVDVRILATSNREMVEAVRQGHFREDLYFRLNVVNIAIPDLKDRPGDIPKLAAFFMEKYAEANGMPSRPLSAQAEALVRAHPWPGNVRELENTMHRAVLLAQGDEIGPDAVLLGDSGQAGQANAAGSGDGGSMVGRTVSDVERELIIDTLGHCLGNRTHAANILGISIRTLRNKLKQYSDSGIQVPQPGGGA